MGTDVFRKTLVRAMTNVETTKVYANTDTDTFFQPASDRLHETPHCLLQIGMDGVAGGNDTFIIRLLRGDRCPENRGDIYLPVRA
jgi:hypothetical protein